MSDQRGPEGREGQPGREGAAGREGLPGVPGEMGAQGVRGLEGKRGKTFSQAIKSSFVILTLIFFLILCGFAWLVHDIGEVSQENKRLATANKLLLVENTNRITDIQKSRTESCQRTYEGIREVLRPFFPPPPRTETQQANLDKFNDKVDELKTNCTKQTDPQEAKDDNRETPG